MKFETVSSYVNKGTKEYRFASRRFNVSVFKREKEWWCHFSINIIVKGFKDDSDAILFAKKAKAKIDKFVSHLEQK